MEWTFLVSASITTSMSVWLFVLKANDLFRVKREGTNGPLLFMVWDNLIRHGFTLGVCVGMLVLAISGINNRDPVVGHLRTFIICASLFACALGVQGLFIYRRREKLALLVAAYEAKMAVADVMPGGQRKTDPPAL